MARININYCLGDMEEAYRDKLHKQFLIEYCREMLFAPAMLRRSCKRLQALIHTTKGADQLNQAIASPQPVVLVSAHMGAMLLGGSVERFKAIWFTQNQGGIFEKILDSRRKSLAVEYVYTDINGVRKAYNELKQGGSVGIFCDHDPGRHGREQTQFFGKDLYTSTLPAKIISKSKAKAFFYLAIRDTNLPWWKVGYTLHIIPVNLDTLNLDQTTGSQKINDQLEGIIRNYPVHFAWNYERFRRINKELYKSVARRKKVTGNKARKK